MVRETILKKEIQKAFKSSKLDRRRNSKTQSESASLRPSKGKRKRTRVAAFEVSCEFCAKSFKTNRKRARFCSDKCRYKGWEKRNPRMRLL